MALNSLKYFIFWEKKNLSFLFFQNQSQITDKPITQQSYFRDNSFDILKGIAIILMILGHCNVGPLKAFIFSFHMPLFFFIAGYFLKTRSLRDEICLSTKRLIVPYIFSAFCVIAIIAIQDILENGWTDFFYTKQKLMAFLLGFKGGFYPNWLNGSIRTFWFILALFWARCIVIFFINKIKSTKILYIITCSLSLLGAYSGEYFFIPYCIPLGLSTVGFVYTGHLIQKFRLLESSNMKKIFPLLFIIWINSWMHEGIDIACFWYPSGYILGLLGALGAFFTLYMFVQNFYNSQSFFWRSIHFWGRYSLIIYCIHAIDENTLDWEFIASRLHISFDFFNLFQISTRIAITFIFTLIILKIKPLRKGIFHISPEL